MHSKAKGGKKDGLDLKTFFFFGFRQFLENYQHFTILIPCHLPHSIRPPQTIVRIIETVDILSSYRSFHVNTFEAESTFFTIL